MESNNNNSNHEQDVHLYDGIVEENNPMPDWWIWLFILCVIFSGIYFLHYASGSGLTLTQEYNQALKNYQADVDRISMTAQVETEDSLAAYMKNELALANGSALYSAKCAMCHGEKLEGKIGPNLTDQFWTTGDGSRLAIYTTITKGSAAKGMPPWEGLLKPKEIKDVASLVYSRIGSNPPNPKAPEGAEIKR
jgi:cytochrome c oxidase cbb3-type subunit III